MNEWFGTKAMLHNKLLSAFQLCGYTGFFLAFVQSARLVSHLHLSELTLLGITGTVILTFYVLMMITKILANGEVIIYYHHEIAVLATSALFLRLTGRPVLPYLDVLVLGLGLFLACGRIGCLLVGCCHGRPCRWGVRYSDDHARAGFPHYLVGVKLFPIQAVESVLAFSIVICGLALLLTRHQSGSVLLFYVIVYGCARFCLEFFRGDVARPYVWGFSEAQWTSLVLAGAALFGEQAKVLPGSTWHPAAAFAMVAAMIFVRIRRHFDRSCRFELLHPAHIQEIKLILQHLKSAQQRVLTSQLVTSAPVVHIAHTSLGYRISAGSGSIGTKTVEHFSISREGSLLSQQGARTFSLLLARLAGRAELLELIQGNNGVFHVLLDDRQVI
ncbi:MAG TPA: prolipoprotein diacylglyceryl transferase family protein [Candidatus Sulfotelmatobacter sp.]|nr:prolipoprotein diacylglyceryl transferase family protein [Candidatus Sulfotelmatobacter sp.]